MEILEDLCMEIKPISKGLMVRCGWAYDGVLTFKSLDLREEKIFRGN